jgi:hypothetical protein
LNLWEGEVIAREEMLHNEKLHKLFSSPNVIRVTKSRRTRWAVHVAHMGEMKNAYKNLS